jgi:hypothetical protein
LAYPQVSDVPDPEWLCVCTRRYDLDVGAEVQCVRETTDTLLTELLTEIERILRESPDDYVGFTLPVVNIRDCDGDQVAFFAYSHLRRSDAAKATMTYARERARCARAC